MMGGNVLLAGADGVLEVYLVENRKTRLIGKIAGLNGRVVDAVILSYTSETDPFSSSKPHVAIVLHGPVPPGQEEASSVVGSEANETAAPRVSLDRRHEGNYYQTRVEVYSLRTGQHFATLFTSALAPCVEIVPGFSMSAPPPMGCLKVQASGDGYIILSSGESGEVFIYGASYSSSLDANAYRCIGKAWTSTQSRENRRYSASSSSTDTDGSRNDSPHFSGASDTATLSVNGRWLAIVPPSSAYKPSIRGAVPSSVLQGRALGLETRSPPGRPPMTCTLDCGERESLFNRVARGVTQELFKGARWMGDQGISAWNNYWSKEQQLPPGTARRSAFMDVPQQYYNAFPPTHGQDAQTGSTSDPEIVSIIDLKRLDEGEARSSLLEPFATFPAPDGCSFLSFSPNGLMLLTASKKGDVQHVWDLMQIRHCRAATLLSDEPTPPVPNVRQVAWYARLTTSTIVDVVWNEPGADRLAIITRKGTVHVYDMPQRAFQWPPFRRSRPPVSNLPSYDSIGEGFPERAHTGNALSAAMKLVGGTTQPFFAAMRGRTGSGSSALPGRNGFAIPTAAGSSKAVAAGLSKSVGAATGTVNTIRQAGGNRLHLYGLSRDPARSRVSWVTHKGQSYLGLVDSGFIRLYAVGRAVSGQKNRQLQPVIGRKEVELRLPAGLQNPLGPMPVKNFDPEATVQATFGLPSSNQPFTSRFQSQPLSQAEIETNAPYQPFHTDQRVNLHVYAAHDEDNSQWIFGDDIPMSRLHVRPLSDGGEDEEGENDEIGGRNAGEPGAMENLISLGNSTDNVEEVVITTRRKKKRDTLRRNSSKDEIDDGFFEDDCEVLDFARDRV